MMLHPFINQMVADQRNHELRRRSDDAQIARSLKSDKSKGRERRWARTRHALPEWRRTLPKIRLHRTRPLVARHRTTG